MKNLLYLLALLAIVSGCAYTQYTKLTEEEFKPTLGEIIITTKDLDDPYIELAIINSEAGTIDRAKKDIVKHAKELGADAIVRFGCGNMDSTGGVSMGAAGTGFFMGSYSPNCSGLAVKLSEPIAGQD